MKVVEIRAVAAVPASLTVLGSMQEALSCVHLTVLYRRDPGCVRSFVYVTES